MYLEACKIMIFSLNNCGDTTSNIEALKHSNIEAFKNCGNTTSKHSCILAFMHSRIK